MIGGLYRSRVGRLLAAGLAAVVLAAALPGGASAQEDLLYNEEPACTDQERGPNHEDCICSVLRGQDSDYYNAYKWETGGAPGQLPSGLRYKGGGDPALDDFVRDKEFKSQCAMTYFREDLRRGWKFAVFVAFGLFTMSFVWGGYVYMQEAAAAEQRATSRGIIFRVMTGLAVVVMAFFMWSIFSDMFLDLGETSLWTPEYEDTIRRPDW